MWQSATDRSNRLLDAIPPDPHVLLRPEPFQNEVSNRDIADDPLVARESVVPDS
jgi:hypothetical protein